MNKLILLSIVLTSFSTLACPNIGGSYSCTRKDSLGTVQNFSMAIRQSGINIQYSTDGSPYKGFPADGVTRDYETMGQVLNLTVYCVNNAVISELEGDVSMSGLEYMMTSRTVIKKDGPILTQEIENSAMDSTLKISVKCEQI